VFERRCKNVAAICKISLIGVVVMRQQRWLHPLQHSAIAPDALDLVAGDFHIGDRKEGA
jgi:hypothetical protein